MEAHLEECLTNVWPKIHKIQRIKLKAKFCIVRTRYRYGSPLMLFR